MAEVGHSKVCKGTCMFTGVLNGTMLLKKSRVLLCCAVLNWKCWCWVYFVSNLLLFKRTGSKGSLMMKKLSWGKKYFLIRKCIRSICGEPRTLSVSSGIQLFINIKQAFVCSCPHFYDFQQVKYILQANHSFSFLLFSFTYALISSFLLWLVSLPHLSNCFLSLTVVFRERSRICKINTTSFRAM